MTAPYGPRNWPREASIARRVAEDRAAAGLPECPWPCCNPPAPNEGQTRVTLAVEDVTNYSDPHRHRSELQYQIGTCWLSSRSSGQMVSWTLGCDQNPRCRWEKQWGRRPSGLEVEALVAQHMAECEYRSVD